MQKTNGSQWALLYCKSELKAEVELERILPVNCKFICDSTST